jgi:superoxide dismutase, Fe-Mn family
MTPHVQDASCTRRSALSLLTLAGFSAAAFAQPTLTGPAKKKALALGGYDESKGEYVLPPLPYAAKALEPHIDAATMEVHHAQHHAAYVAGANRAQRELRAIADLRDSAMVRHWTNELSFNLGGHINHTLFWNMMAPPRKENPAKPTGALAEAIERDFGGFDGFLRLFKGAANQVQSSGWAWLVRESLSKRLIVLQMESHQHRLPAGSLPILGVDVWEHAYYLKYQNRRSEYVEAFCKVIDWEFCGQLYDAAAKE